MDLYLKFDSEAQANDFLLDADGAALYDMAIDVVGVITKVVDNSDPEHPVVQTIHGWHVNTRGEAPDALLPFAINPEPTTPYRVWA